MTWNAVLERQKLAKERLLRLPEQRHVRAILTAAQHGAERDHQYLMQVVAGIVRTWVGDTGKAGDKIVHRAAAKCDPTLGIQLSAAPQSNVRQGNPYAIPPAAPNIFSFGAPKFPFSTDSLYVKNLLKMSFRFHLYSNPLWIRKFSKMRPSAFPNLP